MGRAESPRKPPPDRHRDAIRRCANASKLDRQMTEQERLDKINQLRQRHAEASKLADVAQDKYMLAAANAVRIRNALEDLLMEGKR